MKRELVLAILREHEAELRASGLARVRLFGSVARDEANDASDVDIMVDFDDSRPISLMTVGGIQYRLSELLGIKVDLSSEPWMHEHVRERAVQEAILAF